MVDPNACLSSIQPLDPELIRRMAAGEVIDSLGSVVRELVDNALDAQATRITIAGDPERWQVRVSDDGIGIPQRDLPSAALAHTTSKDPNLG
ncbi:MAG: ATP-binding protein, partial [Cyanophyceae cyanobacterium]